MAIQMIPVPDIGGAENVDVIEVCVAVGDEIAADDALVVLESDKASMDVPSPVAGKVISIGLREGDKVSEGDSIIEIEVEGSDASAPSVNNTSEAVAELTPAVAVSENTVNVPDIGGAEAVDVIELCVAVGDDIAEGDSLIVLESDKASMDIPAPAAGKVLSIGVSEGDKVSEGDPILVLSSETAPSQSSLTLEQAAPVVSSNAASEIHVEVPDIGGAEDVDVIEICVSEGDDVAEGDSLIVLESDKASMEVPAPVSGRVMSLAIKEGDKVSQGVAILMLATDSSASSSVQAPRAEEALASPTASAPTPAAAPTRQRARTSEQFPQAIQSAGSEVYAGPASRKLAREMGVDLSKVGASGPRGRIAKDDIKAYVKSVMQSGGVSRSSGIPPIPEVDFGKFGEIDLVKMSKIKKVTAVAMSRNWLNVPHVTQFDDADITDLEAFRKGMKAEAEKAGVKLTPLPFILKACAAALQAEPSFNVSLHADGEHIVQKRYVHIGVAVDTPNGLMVPVIRDVDKKGLFELAAEVTVSAKKAREGKLMPNDMQGGCFTISSLGPMGGTGFTPIVNAPEVAILGVSKAAIKPVWDGKEFLPRQMLPLCLSYDHRAINGGDAGRFFTYLSAVLGDVRRLLL